MQYLTSPMQQQKTGVHEAKVVKATSGLTQLN